MSFLPRNIKLLHRQSVRFPVSASFESRSSILHCTRETVTIVGMQKGKSPFELLTAPIYYQSAKPLQELA
jgi:hypothetical protein